MFYGEKSKVPSVKFEFQKRKSPSMLTPLEVRRPEAEMLQAQRRNMANNPLNLGATIKPAIISSQEFSIDGRKGKKSMLGRFYS